MNKLVYALALAAMSLGTGCATLTPPSAQSMAQIPVVKFGDQAPADQKFVLLYPAGTPLPVVASVKGTLLDKSDEATLQVKLKHDIYVYQHWASLDGKVWSAGKNIVDGKFEIRLPGEKDGHSPGTLNAEFNQK